LDDIVRYAVSEAANLGVNVCSAIVHADFETVICSDVDSL